MQIDPNLPQFATHPIATSRLFGKSTRDTVPRTRGDGFPSRKLFVARFTDHRFSLWHAILLDSSQRSSCSSMPSKFSNSTVERDTKSMRFGISWREREEGLAHMQMEVYRARARERNRVTARLGDLRIWRHARSVGILVAAWPESRWDQTNETMEEEWKAWILCFPA